MCLAIPSKIVSIDGYPMTKRGEPGRAVGIALVSSLMGALIGAFFLASLLGTLPICFVYAYFGSRGDIANPWPPVLAAVAIPAAGWVVASRIQARGP